MSLTVTIPNTFNGPLDLLLHLIRRDEMDIYDIPIARLTATYLEEMAKLDLVDVDEGAEFLDLASRLLEIKSRMLIPPEEREDESAEEEEDFDPRSGLVEALLEYRRFKDAARLLGEMAEEQARRFPRIAPRLALQPPDGEDDAADCMDLFTAFQALLVRMMPTEDSTVITYTEVPTSVRIEQIQAVLADVGTTRFSLLLSGSPDRREMVGFFIALLELIRQGRVTARQTDNFADIVLE
ncbi:MAG: segregation/condensation protein A, partial [Planctomycetes bacterium]|nr:segregation/condensation protein A [Planctomycetota bacterium]